MSFWADPESLKRESWDSSASGSAKGMVSGLVLKDLDGLGFRV